MERETYEYDGEIWKLCMVGDYVMCKSGKRMNVKSPLTLRVDIVLNDDHCILSDGTKITRRGGDSFFGCVTLKDAFEHWKLIQ